MGDVVSKSIGVASPVSLIDIVVVKKYPVYCLEIIEPKSRKKASENKLVARCYQSFLHVREKQEKVVEQKL